MKIFNYFSDNFGHAGKQLDQKASVNFKIYDIRNWKANNYNTHIAQYIKKLRQSDNENWLVNKI